MSWLEEVANTTPQDDGSWLKDVAETTPLGMNYKGLFPGGLSAKGHEGSSHTPSLALRPAPEPVKPSAQPEMWSLSREEQARTESPLSLLKLQEAMSPVKISKDPGDWIGAGIIKKAGGNWVPGEIKGVIKDLKRAEFPNADLTDPDLWREAALVKEAAPVNSWVDKKLRKYIQNEMASENDSVRKSLETFPERKDKAVQEARGRLEAFKKTVEETRRRTGLTTDELTRSRQRTIALEKELKIAEQSAPAHTQHTLEEIMTPGVRRRRHLEGFPAEGVGKSGPARDWEHITDLSVRSGSVGRFFPKIADFTEKTPEGHLLNPTTGELIPDGAWLKDMHPLKDKLTRLDDPRSLEFGHLVDELHNAINPDSGIPKNLQITPQQLGSLSVPQAMEHVGKINAWRAVNRKEADFAKAQISASPIKEYASGHQWVELKEMPTDKVPDFVEFRGTPDSGYKYGYLTKRPGEEQEYMKWSPPFDTEAEARAAVLEKAPELNLQKALQYEGDTLVHCVGGYCDGVRSGGQRIVSLRNKETGEPLATIELVRPKQRPMDKWSVREVLKPEEFEQYYAAHSEGQSIENQLRRAGLYEEVKARLTPTNRWDIKQIKGRGNGRPPEEAQQAITDFVRSGNHEIIDEGFDRDILHTNLVDLSRLEKEAGEGAARLSAKEASFIPEGGSMTKLISALRAAYPKHRYTKLISALRAAYPKHRYITFEELQDVSENLE